MPNLILNALAHHLATASGGKRMEQLAAAAAAARACHNQ